MSEEQDMACSPDVTFECSQCGGNGWVLVPEHHPECDGSCRLCPVEARIQCDRCGGAGVFHVVFPLKLWIDDIRPPPDNSWTWVKDSLEAASVIFKFQPDAVSFDHDLGEGRNGHQIASHIEELAYSGAIRRFAWHVHSQNPVGADQIRAAMRKVEEIWSRQEQQGAGQ